MGFFDNLYDYRPPRLNEILGPPLQWPWPATITTTDNTRIVEVNELESRVEELEQETESLRDERDDLLSIIDDYVAVHELYEQRWAGLRAELVETRRELEMVTTERDNAYLALDGSQDTWHWDRYDEDRSPSTD